MPNNVHITFTAVGEAERITAFIQQARGTRKPTGDVPEDEQGRKNYNYHPERDESAFEFDRLVPLPDSYSLYSYSDHGYELESRTWGTKWGAYGVKGPTQKRETEVTYTFTVAWEPPKLFFEKVSMQWPDLLFAISYGGEGPCLGHFSIHHGVYACEEEGDYHDAPPEDEDNEEASYALYKEWQEQYRRGHDAYVLSLL